MRVTYDRGANALHVRFSEGSLPSGRQQSVPVPSPEGVEAFVVIDWKGDTIVGLEVLDASIHLDPDFLDQAEIIG
jgi:uncharacterized protein YuzE